MWRLDAPTNRGGPDGKGPLLDPQGKVSVKIQGRSARSEETHSALLWIAVATVHDPTVERGRAREVAGAGLPGRPPVTDDVDRRVP